jgi:hypothetical protein
MVVGESKEIVLVPTYKRPEMLFYCLTMLRAYGGNDLTIAVFPDRGTYNDKEFQDVMSSFDERNTHALFVPDHDYYGNSFNTMEAFRFAYNADCDLTYYVEDDVMVHWDFFHWHRAVQEEESDIFASMGWIFNHYAPITMDLLFQPWYYSVGTCFSREKLKLIVDHATPRYYKDMPGYIEKTFAGSVLNTGGQNIQHYEQDGLIQRVMDRDHTQVVCRGIASCTHLGTFGYNKGWEQRDSFFGDAKTFEQRLQKISDFVADPYWRASLFGRPIVEREIGKELPPRMKKYLLRVGPYECEYESELKPEQFPKRVRSVPRTPDMEIVVE